MSVLLRFTSTTLVHFPRVIPRTPRIFPFRYALCHIEHPAAADFSTQGSERKHGDISQDIWDLFDKLGKDDAAKLRRFKTYDSLTFLDHSFLVQENIGNEKTRANLIHEIHERLRKKNLVVNYKVFNDPVHGSIQVHPLAVLIIDTPLFQRLRSLKQMGGISYVYPGATHTRFEHSIGVYHLAGKVVNLLKVRQPELRISAMQAMGVQIAGLCHDLGHGPFSHLFEGAVDKIRKKEMKENNTEEWTHEKQSVKIMEHILTENAEGFKNWGFQEEQLEFIISLVEDGEKICSTRKGFLYEIVSNSENGMDVDKWDYLARDSYHSGVKNNFEQNRLIFHFKVLPEDQSKGHICVRDKEQFTAFTMYAARYALHKLVCQHPVSQGVQMMIAKALELAAKHLKFAGKGGKSRTMLQALDDMEAYTNLHDGIYHMILNYTRPDTEGLDEAELNKVKDLTKAKDLLEKIERRDLWKCVGQLVPQDKLFDTSSELSEDVISAQALMEKLTMKVINAQDLTEELQAEVTSAQDGGTNAQDGGTNAQDEGTHAEDLRKKLQAEITSAQGLMKERRKKLTSAKRRTKTLDGGLVDECDVMKKLKSKLDRAQVLAKDAVESSGKLLRCISQLKEILPEIILEDLTKVLNEMVLDKEDGLFIAEWTNKDFGRKTENPLKNIRFFTKDGKCVEENKMKLLVAPNKYSFKAIRVYWTGNKEYLTDDRQKEIKSKLEKWAATNKLRITNGHE